MINKRELRIGNLLYWDCDNLCAGEGYVAELSEESFRFLGNNGCHPHGDEYDEIKPIPLTPEWLEKLGFVKMTMPFTWESGYGMAGKGNFIGFVPRDDNGWLMHNPHFSTTYYYVHQLQNLYFALMGEELNIKELQP